MPLIRAMLIPLTAAALVAGVTAPATAATVQGAIEQRWNQLGAAAGVLGEPLTDELPTPLKPGRFNHFQGGSIYWSTSTGAWEVRGAIRDKWESLGWENSSLGFPAGPMSGLARDGAFSRFQGGSIYTSPATGTYVVGGAIRDAWGQTGWENGPLGFPRTDEVATPTKPGRYNHFEAGSIYWSPFTGAWDVRGLIRDRWAGLGWEQGFLGFPTGPTRGLVRDGAFSTFQGGSIYSTPTTGAHEVHGAILEAWARSGYENGPLGYPLTDELGTPSSIPIRYNHFEGGSIYWSKGTGAHVVRGAIHEKWESLGWEMSSLGLPLTDEIPLAGGAFTVFQGGSIYWSAETGAHVVQYGIRDMWVETGAENGSLGFPASDSYPIPTDTGYFLGQDFEFGRIGYAPTYTSSGPPSGGEAYVVAFLDEVTTVDRDGKSFYVDAVGTEYSYDSADTLHWFDEISECTAVLTVDQFASALNPGDLVAVDIDYPHGAGSFTVLKQGTPTYVGVTCS